MIDFTRCKHNTRICLFIFKGNYCLQKDMGKLEIMV